MNFNFQNKIIRHTFSCFQFSIAQKKEETIGSEVVNVVKPYITISDAFKIKEILMMTAIQKEIIRYTIFSFQ
jgi:hypothetical protein